jgi:Thiamine pyrophosphate enzyme, N-terminal TPP binding domain
MSGAQALIRTLTGCGVEVCFSNPGTSEMHFVAALDDVPEMRGVLCLFEGAATGAADGYGRMTGRPAAALLHLGPGLANGLANLHNARRAHTPLLAVVGDHATWHKQFDSPLESGHRCPGRRGVGLGPAAGPQRRGGGGRGQRGRRGDGTAGRGRHPHPAGGRVLVRRRRAGTSAASPATGAGTR